MLGNEGENVRTNIQTSLSDALPPEGPRFRDNAKRAAGGVSQGGGGSGFPHFWQNAAALALPMPHTGQ